MKSYKDIFSSYAKAEDSRVNPWQKPRSRGNLYYSPTQAEEMGFSPARGRTNYSSYILVHTSSLKGWVGQRSAAYISIWGK